MSARIGVLAYGPADSRHAEATAALLTTSAFAPTGTEFVVFTDRPARYRWLADLVQVEALTPSTLREWQGAAGDLYRPKIEALRQLARDGTRDVLLLDTDILARRDLSPLLDRLANGATVLHRREYLLADPPRNGDRPLRREILGRAWDGITPAAESAAMWNGGVIGSPRRHVGLFDRVLRVFDEMRVASRHFAVEQLAYSIVFPEYGPVEEAAPWLDHYWANRPHFDREIERFLAGVAMESLSAADARDRLRVEPIAGALDARRPWWYRRLQRVLEEQI